MASRNTLISLFVQSVSQRGDHPALLVKRNGAFGAVSWNQLADDVRRLAAVLLQCDVQPGDRVIQVSENRYLWIVTDLAIQMAQAVHVPVHATLTGEQIAYQIQDCGARLALLANDKQAAKLASCDRMLPGDLRCLAYDPTCRHVGSRPVQPIPTRMSQVGAPQADQAQQLALRQLSGASLATILYTSGTTGEPKGVMLSQSSLVSNTLATLEVLPQQPSDIRLGFLPLSHVFARTCDLYTWIASGSQLALAESRETVLDDCAAIRPTLLNGVPYFFDKVYRLLTEQGRADQPGSLRALLGGAIRICCCGGAAVSDHIVDFFHRHEVPLLPGYGLSETSPVISACTLQHMKRGTVGKPIPGIEVRIAEDGEILTRGPHVMLGYYKNPDATNDVIRDGWLHTGDLGALDEEGFLKITGRKKEVLVMATGKTVSPVLLEGLLMQDPLILQAIVIGDDRKYLAALIVPNPDSLRVELQRQRIAVHSRQKALTHPKVRQLYRRRLDERLAHVSRQEQVRKFTLLDRSFTIDSGELTPKLSLRRKVIEANCAEQIEAMYDEEEQRG